MHSDARCDFEDSSALYSYGLPTLMANVPSATELAGCLRAVAASQDRAAFLILFEHYAPRLKSYFSRLGLQPGAADDLVQETMLRLWNKAGYFDPAKGSPSTWVFTIARNLRVTGLRGHRLAQLKDDMPEVEDPAPRPDRLLAFTEIESRLRQALESLPEAQADLLRASFFEEKSHPELARERNMPLGTVKSHLRRTLIRLRKALTEGL